MEILIYLAVGVVLVYLLYKAVVFIKKKRILTLKVSKKEKKEKPQKKLIDNPSVVMLAESYMSKRELNALIALNKVLPKEYITLPKVGVANLLAPIGNRNLYNTIKDYFIDFVVFEESTMKPILVVDIFDNSFEDELLRQRHPDLIELLLELKLPFIEFAVKGEINLSALQTKLFDAIGNNREKSE